MLRIAHQPHRRRWLAAEGMNQAGKDRVLAQVTHLRDSFRNFRDGILISGATVRFLHPKADVVKTRPLASR